jgi:AcrR family transcriptional regulator
LERGAIIDAAIQLAARGEQVTFRALGRELGSDPTAVYRHFRDKDELLRAIIDQHHVEVLGRLDRSGSWREQLTELARQTLQMAMEHPAIGVELRRLTTGGPGELAMVETLLTLLSSAGLGREDAVRFYAVLSNHALTGASAQAMSRLQLGGIPEAEAVQWFELHAVDMERYPAVAASLENIASLRDTEIYLIGVEVILDAAQAAATRQPGGAPEDHASDG